MMATRTRFMGLVNSSQKVTVCSVSDMIVLMRAGSAGACCTLSALLSRTRVQLMVGLTLAVVFRPFRPATVTVL